MITPIKLGKPANCVMYRRACKNLEKRNEKYADAEKCTSKWNDLATLSFFISLPFIATSLTKNKKFTKTEWLGVSLLLLSFVSMVISSIKKYQYYARNVNQESSITENMGDTI